MQHRRPRGHRRLSRRRIGIAAEVVIEAPAADVLTQGDGFRHALRITDLGEQAVEQRQAVIDPIPAARMALPHHPPAAIDQQVGAAQERSGPDRLGLDLRVQCERRTTGRRVTQIDGVAELVGGKSQFQAHGSLPGAALQRNLAGHHPAIKGFGAGP
ncbi:hypothetical protein G6F40_015104 [Rhizopus arrhizus]|nr:hypothetical protein G6F40_015104 [Rhizopus arrhizus]